MYATYRQWSQGDEYLDFEGEELRQGKFGSVFIGNRQCASMSSVFTVARQR